MLPKFSQITRSFILGSNRFNKQSSVLKNLYDDFPNYFPKIIESSLIEKKYADKIEIRERITKVCTYQISAYDSLQGKLTMFAFDGLADQKNVTAEQLHQVKVLAWAVELVLSYFNITDDITDKANTRYGKPCWHLLPDVGSLAINDISLLRNFIYEMLKHNFDESMSHKLHNLFDEAFFTINIGQHVDVMLTRSTAISDFTMEHYNEFTSTTSFYTAKLPILVALELCNKANNDAYSYIDKICNNLGILIQIQNDLMDYIDLDSKSIKTSSDIQLRKFSWVAVAVLENCNESQRKVMETCYGQKEPEKVERIRQLYKEFDLVALYRMEEQRRYRTTFQRINELPPNATPSADFFHKILHYFRQYTQKISQSSLIK